MGSIMYTLYKVAIVLVCFAALGLGISWSWEEGPLSYQPLSGGALILTSLYVLVYTALKDIRGTDEKA